MIQVDIVTPQRQLVTAAKVDSVTLPAMQGEIEVLPNHTEYVAALGTGVLSFTENGKKRVFAVSNGFAEVLPHRVMVMAETCEESHEINKDRVIEAIEKSQKALGALITRDDFLRYEQKLQRNQAREKALK